MLTHLECTRCGEHYPAGRPQTVCPKDAGILYARYDLAAIKRSFSSARLAGRTPTMWRYDAVLPDANPVSLGEGFTPMLPSREFPNVYIKDEGLNRSKVMETLSYLSDVIGARLTASPNAKRANEWTRDRLAAWGLQNAHLEAWGPFGRGWQLKRFSAEVVEPQSFPLFAYPKAWSPSTSGPLTAEVVYVSAANEQELQKYNGTLRGKIVLNGPVRDLKAHFDPDATLMVQPGAASETLIEVAATRLLLQRVASRNRAPHHP